MTNAGLRLHYTDWNAKAIPFVLRLIVETGIVLVTQVAVTTLVSISKVKGLIDNSLGIQ